jgi:hypothetical protein
MCILCRGKQHSLRMLAYLQLAHMLPVCQMHASAVCYVVSAAQNAVLVLSLPYGQ